MTDMTTTRSTPLLPTAAAKLVPLAHTGLALLVLMIGIAIAGLALIAAAIAVPVGLLVQSLVGETRPKARRGWQPATA